MNNKKTDKHYQQLSWILFIVSMVVVVLIHYQGGIGWGVSNIECKAIKSLRHVQCSNINAVILGKGVNINIIRITNDKQRIKEKTNKMK